MFFFQYKPPYCIIKLKRGDFAVYAQVKYDIKTYKHTIDSDNTQIQNKLWKRYLLRVRTLKENDIKYTFLLMNPSAAVRNKSDRTVNKVIKDAFNDGAGIVDVVNIFPFYETNSKKLGKVLDKISDTDLDIIQKENLEKIKLSIKSSIKSGGKVICGWGNRPTKLNKSNMMIYNSNLHCIKNILSEYSEQLLCYDTNITSMPSHPLYKYNDFRQYTLT
ncbi:hypothetical protein C2U27_03460 [Bacillus aerophilus]|nr:hypothetical protein [Bacillus aerophilus]